jgi:hypothetical protein
MKLKIQESNKMSDKKRTTYNRGSRLDLPKHVDKTKFGYRWINAENLKENTDGYEPRGYQLDTDESGKHTRRGDLVLARMPIDMYEAMKAQKEEDKLRQTELIFQRQAEQAEQEAFAFRKKGGRIKFELKQE